MISGPACIIQHRVVILEPTDISVPDDVKSWEDTENTVGLELFFVNFLWLEIPIFIVRHMTDDS